jgi:hypothetical protein
MQARISAVQQALIVVTIVAFVVAALVRPAPDNADYRRALAELTSLGQRFDRSKVERALLDHAKAQGTRPLSSLVQPISALRPINVRVADPAASIEPIATLTLSTLADIDRYAQPGATLAMSAADLGSVPSSLAWRLTREASKDAAITLRSAQLQLSQADADAVALEAQIAQLQTEQLAARVTAERNSVQVADQTKLLENRIKWRVSRQLRSDTYKALQDMRKTQRDGDRALRDLDKRYEAAVSKAAEAARAVGKAGAAAAGMSAYGVLQVELGWAAETKHYAIPVRVQTLQAQLPPLGGVTLAQTHAAGVWDEVRDLDVAKATSAVQERFNWHYRYIDLAGIKLGGVAVLQLIPCILPVLLLLLLTRMRAVAQTYNPFRTRVKEALPRVGFRTRILDALAVVVLPLLATVFAVASLMIVGQIPALPLLAAVACLLLGAYAFIKLGELQRLVEDVVRSHSVPPPEQEPSTTTTNTPS